jgi:hypothetical protein
MTRMGQARALGLLPFPEKNGPVVWPQCTIVLAANTCPVSRQLRTASPKVVCDVPLRDWSHMRKGPTRFTISRVEISSSIASTMNEESS